MPVFSLPCILLVQLASLNYILVSCYSFLPLNFHGEGGFWQEECAGILFRRLFLLLKFYVRAVQCSYRLSLQLCHQSTWARQPERQAGGLQYGHLVDQVRASFLDERHSEIALLNRLSALQCTAGRLIRFQRPHSTIPLFAGRPTKRICWICEPNFNCSGSPPEEGLFMLKETSLKFQRIFQWYTCKSIWKTTETGIDTVLYTSWVQLFSDRHLYDCLLVPLST